MALTNTNAINQIAAALATNSSRLIIDKSAIGNQTPGRMCSIWRATGIPAQGAIPTAPALCTHLTLGAIGFDQQTLPVESYLALLSLNASSNTMSWEVHDRLAHMGGLVLNVITNQTVGLNLDTLNPGADRIGSADYGDIQPWLEVYTNGGATASNATVNVTFNDDSSGNLNVISVGGTLRSGNMLSLNSFKTPAQQALKIKRINTVILSASTGTAGNFGFTFTRPRAFAPTPLANYTETYDWAYLGLPAIPNNSCLFITILPSTTTSATLRGVGKIIHA